MDEKEEFKVLVAQLLANPSESRCDEILGKLDVISPDPSYSDYIYHSKEFELPEGNLDIEGLADRVFNYKPFQL